MSAQPKILLSVEEYLQMEDEAPYKSEYFKGEVFAMAGASPVHNRIVGNLNSIIGSHLWGKKCRFFPSDQRVFVDKYPYFTYPDLTIACNTPEYFGENKYTLTNPTAIIEVLSPSTANYDKGIKFGLFRGALSSLQEYIMISSFRHHVEIYYKIEGEFWGLTTDCTDLNAEITIKSINLKIPMKDIYFDTEIENFDNVIDFRS